MLRRYRDQLIFALTILLCFVYVGLWGQDPPKGASSLAAVATLKPGDEVKPLELEGAKLGKLKAQIQRDEAQESALQSQYNATEADKRALQASLDTLVQSITARVKKETGAEIVYDPRTGEDGTFHVNSVPSPAPGKKP
jgi:hypothetical protein